MGRVLIGLVPLLAWGAALTVASALVGVTGYLLVMGGGTIGRELIFGAVDPLDAVLLRSQVTCGLFPAVVGTCLLVVISVALSVPAGILSGIYLSEYAGPGRKRLFGLLFDILAGIPSIVVGLFGFSIAVFLHRHLSGRIYPCLLISALSLSVLVLPCIIGSTRTALEGLPRRLRLTGLSLGATKLQNILHVLIPSALPGIFSGIVLAVGRCAEDTAVIMLTGVVISAGVPGSLLGEYEALPFHIYYISSQYASAEELSRGFGAALILMATSLLLLALAKATRWRMGRRRSGVRELQ